MAAQFPNQRGRRIKLNIKLMRADGQLFDFKQSCTVHVDNSLLDIIVSKMSEGYRGLADCITFFNNGEVVEKEATPRNLEMKPGDTFGMMMFRNLDEDESRLVKILSLETITGRSSKIQAYDLETLEQVTVYKTPEELINSCCLNPLSVIVTLGPPRSKDWNTEVQSTTFTVSLANIGPTTLFGDLLEAWCRVTRQDLQRRQVVYQDTIYEEDCVVLDELSGYKHEQLGKFYFSIFPVHESSPPEENEGIVEGVTVVEETRQGGKTGKKKRAKLRKKRDQGSGARHSASDNTEIKGETLNKTDGSEVEGAETEEKRLKKELDQKTAELDENESKLKKAARTIAMMVQSEETAEEEHKALCKSITEVEKKITELDLEKEELLARKKEKQNSLKSAHEERRKMEVELIATAEPTKTKVSVLKTEIEELHLKLSTLKEGANTKRTKLNVELFDYISRKIEEKEKEVECPVCLETASPPILMCEDQHLICSSCKPQLGHCPECRAPYRGEVRRHRYAEKAADDLTNLMTERDQILNA